VFALENRRGEKRRGREGERSGEARRKEGLVGDREGRGYDPAEDGLR